jgi:MazG family protein
MTGPDFSAIARSQGASRAAPEREAIARVIDLLGVVYRLRDDDGCPWDRAQSVDSMALNLLEEAAETHEAVAAGDDAAVCEELGDTLMNILLIARIAEQGGRFGLAQVAAGIAEKLVRRHPHVFGDKRAGNVDEALASWNEAKDAEQAAKKQRRASALDGVPEALPALAAALRVGQKAAVTGFDWPDVQGALAKLDEETAELRQAVSLGDARRIEEELGDVLWAAAAVARKQGLDPELVLKRGTAKFRQRFAAMEAALGPRLGQAPLDELERAWFAAAARERGGGSTLLP